jgi:serine/threonine protein kinase/tetratricopeptide (TPR) repeat protein
MNEETLFHLLLEKPQGERAEYLDKACGGDAGLRRRVEVLLRAHENPGSFLESPAAAIPSPLEGEGMGVRGTTINDPITERPGTVIGSYRLMEQIGEGGMGLVFVAEQQYPVRRKVALKVIKPGMDTRQVVARFEAERQALALMDHPNIAKVFDGGTTGGERGRVSAPSTPGADATRLAGRPYFVMELVKGVPITEYCDQNQVPIPERLELFLSVCQAVQHAHQKGIIHRDIKPSNVLVMSNDGTPLVKVIDFGVAKAIGQQLTDKTIYTQFTQLVGTPLYMSPEQAGQSGVDVDTRTDIYALGVLLYELLTGTTPFDKDRLSKASYEEIRRIIREEEPPKPSTRVSTLGQAATTVSTNRKSDPKRLSQLFRGELDWIVMKALEKDRNRRYETANAFAADVLHYLHDEPVLACPPSAGYRFGKFARRNRVALTLVSVVTAALLLLLAGLSAGVIMLGRANLRIQEQRDQIGKQSVELKYERDQAQENFHKALEAVDTYFTQVSENKLLKSPLPGLQPLRKELLETALKYYRAFVEEHHEDPNLRAELARALLRVGMITESIGRKDEGLQALQLARDIWLELARDNSDDWRLEGELASTYMEIGVSQCRFLGQTTAGLQVLEQARILYEKLVAEHPDVTDLQKGLAEDYALLAEGYRIQDQLPEMGQYLQKSLKVWERLAKAKPEFQDDLARSLSRLGYWYDRTGRPEEALRCHYRALEILKPLTRSSTDLSIQLALAFCYMLISDVHQWMTGQLDKALEADERAAQIYEKVIRENPSLSQIQYIYAGDILTDFGCIYTMTGRFDRAIEYDRRAIDMIDRLRGEDPGNVHWQMSLILTSAQLAEAQRNAGQLDEAFRLLERARASFEELNRAHPSSKLNLSEFTGYLLGQIANAQRDAGHAAEALPLYEQAIDSLQKLLHDRPSQPRRQGELARIYCDLGLMQRDQGRYAEAEASFRKGIQILQELGRAYPTNARFVREAAAAHLHLGSVHAATGKTNEALALLRQAKDSLEKLTGILDFYALAGVYAQLSTLPAPAKQGRTPEEQAERRRFADKAMAALQKAVAAGYHYKAVLKRDRYLDPLRSRQDFQQLLAEVGTKR